MRYSIDLSKEKRTRILCVLYCYERNYYKYKRKISLQLEQIQKERTDSAIWLEVQTLKDRMSGLYRALNDKIQHPHTKTSDLSNLVSTAESISINIMKLESASITAIQQSNILESHVNTQLPSKSKYKELPKISYVDNNQIESKALEESNISENINNDITYND
ncbi:MAG TPA: hypothetical protein VLA74_00235 [Nitrososphaeraceae archaeon]|nr:hypothetical protein [Nitrososphaeraceae archaeon]